MVMMHLGDDELTGGCLFGLSRMFCLLCLLCLLQLHCLLVCLPQAAKYPSGK